jgi:hypothetical protein
LAITPDQAPEAELSVIPAPAGSPTSFDASASVAPSSPISSYAWNFGDGHTATTSTPTTTHTYSTSGSFTATVTETDTAGTSTAGTSTAQVFTGQTVSLNGGAQAVASQSFEIVACPANSSCSGAADNTSQNVTVGGTSSTVATLSVSLGSQLVSCGKGAAETEQVTTYSTTTFTASSLSATLTVDNDSSTKDFEVCYSSATPFTDDAGKSVTVGYLPTCAAVSDVAPYIVSLAISGGDLLADLSVLSGDPRMWGAPVLSAFTPTEGQVGTKVTIKGGP